MDTEIIRVYFYPHPYKNGQWRIYVFLVSSNNPKKVHATNEISPVTKDIMTKRNFPIKSKAMAVVIKIKETIK